MDLLTSGIEDYLKQMKARVDEGLDKLIPPAHIKPQVLHESMRYSIFAGGKRFRPILTLVSCLACGGRLEQALPTACALEMIHTYSLIHDDLPAMDNDDYRRGELSNHKKFSEDIAILAGDALLTLAFQIADIRVVSKIAMAIGSLGVVGGQVADMQLVKKEIPMTLENLEYIHHRKTGELISVSAEAGAVLAETDSTTVQALKRYGERIGFAFQIVDDIFDNENYAVLLGKEKAAVKARENAEAAIEELEILPVSQRGRLIELAQFVIERKE